MATREAEFLRMRFEKMTDEALKREARNTISKSNMALYILLERLERRHEKLARIVGEHLLRHPEGT